MRSLSTGLNLVTSTWPSCRSRLRGLTLSRVGRHTRQSSGLSLELGARRRPPRPARNVVHNTLHQTIVRVFPTRQLYFVQHTRQFHTLHTQAFLLVVPPPRRDPPAPGPDFSRPTRTARRLLRLFSMESARRQLRPFYSSIVRSVLREEQDRYRSRPTQAISLIWHLFGRRQAFRTLTRFYLSAVEKLGTNYYPALRGQNALYLAAGVVLHSQVYQRYLRQLWSRESPAPVLRYARHEQTVTDDLLRLQVARGILPPRETLERLAEPAGGPVRPAVPAPAQEVRLSDADFRALVQGVTSSLGRRSRLNALRRGETAL